MASCVPIQQQRMGYSASQPVKRFARPRCDQQPAMRAHARLLARCFVGYVHGGSRFEHASMTFERTEERQQERITQKTSDQK